METGTRSNQSSRNVRERHRYDWIGSRPLWNSLARYWSLPRKLAGDRMAELAERFGLARLARSLARVTGKGCRCEQRRQWLNRLHARLIARRPEARIDRP